MIYTKQLEPNSLTAFIVNVMSGTAFSGLLSAYAAGSGTYGPNVLYTTGAQTITGIKTFLNAPVVPYSGNTGTAPSTLFVLDQIAALNVSNDIYLNRGLIAQTISGLKIFTGALGVGNPTSTGHAANLGTVTGASGQLTSLRVTGSSNIMSATLSGIGGTQVIWSGGFIFVSGGAGGGGGSSVLVTGGSVSTPNFTGRGNITLSYDGTYVNISGNASAGAPNAVFQTGDQNISGQKIFTGNPLIASPTLPSGATNVLYVSGISGALQTLINNASPTTNNYIFSGITGNFVNMSFFFDKYSLATGLATLESFVGRNFICTGVAIGVINSGTQGFFSGSFYQRTPTNSKTNFIDFSLNSGMFFSGIGVNAQTVSGMNRVGLDIYRIGTGITGLTVGLFGVGY